MTLLTSRYVKSLLTEEIRGTCSRCHESKKQPTTIDIDGVYWHELFIDGKLIPKECNASALWRIYEAIEFAEEHDHEK